MSAGEFEQGRYEASYDETQIHPIRLQPETTDMIINPGAEQTTNGYPTGAITNPISAQVSLTRRQIGLRARFITIRWTGTPPVGYDNEVLKVVVPDRSTFNAIAIGTPVQYLNSPATVVSKEPERVR